MVNKEEHQHFEVTARKSSNLKDIELVPRRVPTNDFCDGLEPFARKKKPSINTEI